MDMAEDEYGSADAGEDEYGAGFDMNDYNMQSRHSRMNQHRHKNAMPENNDAMSFVTKLLSGGGSSDDLPRSHEEDMDDDFPMVSHSRHSPPHHGHSRMNQHRHKNAMPENNDAMSFVTKLLSGG